MNYRFFASRLIVGDGLASVNQITRFCIHKAQWLRNTSEHNV